MMKGLCFFLLFAAVVYGDWWSYTDRLTYIRELSNPEGIEFDDIAMKFLVGSVSTGGLFHVDDNSAVTIFAEPFEGMSTLGIRVAEDMVAVAMNAECCSGLADFGVGIYFRNGTMMKFISLSGIIAAGPQFVNDLVFDSDGYLYVTESFQGIIFKVDVMNGTGEVFLQEDAMRPPAGQFGLNGIIFTKAKKLGDVIIANWQGDGVLQSRLFTIPLKDKMDWRQLNITDTTGAFSASDGMQFDEETDTLMTVHRTAVLSLKSEDAFRNSAEVTFLSQISSECTTGVLLDQNLYASCWAGFGSPGPNMIIRAGRGGDSGASNLVLSMSSLLGALFVFLYASQ